MMIQTPGKTIAASRAAGAAERHRDRRSAHVTRAPGQARIAEPQDGSALTVQSQDVITGEDRVAEGRELTAARSLVDRAAALLVQARELVAGTKLELEIVALLSELNALSWRRGATPFDVTVTQAPVMPLTGGWCRPASRTWRWR